MRLASLLPRAGGSGVSSASPLSGEDGFEAPEEKSTLPVSRNASIKDLAGVCGTARRQVDEGGAGSGSAKMLEA